MTSLAIPVPTLVPLRWPVGVRQPEAGPASVGELVARWGTDSVSPFTLGPERHAVRLPGGGVLGYHALGRWAVMAAGPIAPPGRTEETLDQALEVLGRRSLRPLFAAVGEPGPYLERGMHSWTIAEDPVIHLADFGLGGSRMAGVRHSVSAALRSGLRITSLTEKYFCGAAEVSRLWLQKKRGAEMGFTLGRFIPSELEGVDCQVALDAEDRVVAFVTWRSYANGSGRVLDLMRRSAHAPNPTMDLLVADGLGRFAQAGVDEASLGSVPVAHGRLGERFYPTRSLRRYKDKFAPEWQPRYLVTPSRPSLPGALAALGRSYCPGGLARAIRRND